MKGVSDWHVTGKHNICLHVHGKTTARIILRLNGRETSETEYTDY